MSELESLAQQYKRKGITSKERAALEQKMWELRTPELVHSRRELHKREMFLHSLVGGSLRDFALRGRIYNLGDAMDPIWERVDQDLSLTGANELVAMARKRVKIPTQEALSETIKQVLKEYDARPIKRVLGNGKIAKLERPSRLRSPEELRKKAIRPKVRKKDEAETSRAFWSQLRELVAGYIHPKLSNAPPVVAERMLKEFEVDLKVLLESFSVRLSKASKEERLGVVEDISRKRVMEACRVLTMDPPKPGKPVDLKVAFKLRGRLGQHYHADKHQNASPEVQRSMADMYQSVMEAYPVLEQYNNSLTNGQEVHDVGNS